jgi:hypothetical protein
LKCSLGHPRLKQQNDWILGSCGFPYLEGLNNFNSSLCLIGIKYYLCITGFKKYVFCGETVIVSYTVSAA